MTLRALEPLPEGLLVYAFVKDWDDQWMQIRHEIPGDGTAEFTLHLPLRGPQTAAWRPRNHRRPWHQLTAGQARELGLKFDSDSPVAEFASEVEVVDVAMDDGAALPPGEVRNLWKQPSGPEVGKKIEIGFEVTHPFHNPFDRSDVDLRATIIGPDGATVVVPGFYFEDFLFDHEDDQSTQIPFGNPQFRVRFTPTLPGPHSFVISGSIGSQSVSLPVIKMDVAAPEKPWPGFVSRSVRDDRLLAFGETGEEFCPVGVNVRSPFDFRYLESFPHTRWRWQNLSMYKRLFQRYKEAGINSIEVWMSPWWLALEWMPDALGNHGVGYMNPWRAWKMDQLFAWAAEYDIHIVLLLHNHGKFSTWCDTDWDRSPFNVTRGGAFEQPSEFFSSREGKRTTKRFLDYVVARWGHSPQLLTWKLFSEIDLTGEHWQWYKEGPALSWHREMGRYLDDIDPYHHLVSTHWSDNFGKVNKELAGVPELDLVLLDGYYQGTGASKLFNVIVGTGEFARDMHKPCLITEFGGNPWGDSMGHIWHLHHVGLWAGFMNKLAGIPFFWWFSMLEEKDMYGRYEALSKFVADEDRSGAEPYVHSEREDGLILCGLRKGDRMWGWMFDPEFYFSGKLNQNEQTHEDRKLRVVGLEAGEYDVEFWNPRTGEIMAIESITARDHASGIISLPTFSRDIAFKIKLQE
ncbi:MAG: hypothetical protein ACI8W8_003803 [Rhodothermales bacterium]